MMMMMTLELKLLFGHETSVFTHEVPSIITTIILAFFKCVSDDVPR